MNKTTNKITKKGNIYTINNFDPTKLIHTEMLDSLESAEEIKGYNKYDNGFSFVEVMSIFCLLILILGVVCAILFSNPGYGNINV